MEGHFVNLILVSGSRVKYIFFFSFFLISKSKSCIGSAYTNIQHKRLDPKQLSVGIEPAARSAVLSYYDKRVVDIQVSTLNV